MIVNFKPNWLFNLIDVSIEQGDRYFTWEIETLGL